eukprot:Hpha_TRINITY_DN15906_c0_g3::TRINITY_DN15906_c0_g3_i1::g.70643::m.70643
MGCGQSRTKSQRVEHKVGENTVEKTFLHLGKGTYDDIGPETPPLGLGGAVDMGGVSPTSEEFACGRQPTDQWGFMSGTNQNRRGSHRPSAMLRPDAMFDTDIKSGGGDGGHRRSRRASSMMGVRRRRASSILNEF